MNKIKALMISILIFSLSSLCMAGDYSILVNPVNPVDSISNEDLTDILLGKKTTWKEGLKIKVAVYKKGETHKALLADTVKKSPMQFSLYWKKILFSGSGTPIHIVKDENEMVDFVAKNPGAVGYVAKAGDNEKVKVIKVLK